MGGIYTESQKKASAEYRKKLKQLGIRVREEKIEEYKQAAEKSKEGNLRAFVIVAIEEKIERENLREGKEK